MDMHGECDGSLREIVREAIEGRVYQISDKATGRKGELIDHEDDGLSEHSDESVVEIQQDRKQSQMAATLQWLNENYERAEGVCLPRCVLYSHYLDFCKKRVFTPSGAATFGKILRQKFPKLTTRRLGTRGQSKYHYYGIGVKESSTYYHSVYRGKGLTRFSGAKVKSDSATGRKYSLSSKAGTLLPDFPEARLLQLPDSLPLDKVETFLMMYRTHCQRVLDTVISANFDEVQNFFLHFWQGMPDHLVPLLSRDIIVDLIGLCDVILYKILNDVLIPSSIQDIPDSLSEEIRRFSESLSGWLELSLNEVPEKIKKTKMKVVHSFIRNLRRQMTFVQLAQAARNVLLSQENVSQMAADLSQLDFHTIFVDMAVSRSRGQPTLITSEEESHWWKYISEFEGLLNKQAPVESYTEWLDNMVDRTVLQPAKKMAETPSALADLERLSRDFLLLWSYVTAKIMRNLTLESAAGFGSFHLIYMMFNEYVFLVVETQQALTLENDLQENVRKHCSNANQTTLKKKTELKESAPESSKRNIEKNLPDCTNVTEKHCLEKEKQLLVENNQIALYGNEEAVFLQSYQDPSEQQMAPHYFGGGSARYYAETPFTPALNVYDSQQTPPAYFPMAAPIGYHGYPEPYSPPFYLPGEGGNAVSRGFGSQLEANYHWAASRLPAHCAPNYVDPYAVTPAYRINSTQVGFSQSQSYGSSGVTSGLLTPRTLHAHQHQYSFHQPKARAASTSVEPQPGEGYLATGPHEEVPFGST